MITDIKESKNFTISEHSVGGKRHILDKSIYAKDGNALSGAKIYLGGEYGMFEGDAYEVHRTSVCSTIRILKDVEHFKAGEWYDLDIDFKNNKILMFQDK